MGYKLSTLCATFHWDSCPRDPIVQRLVTDSRQVQTGDLFLAFPGSQVDGRTFIDEAMAKGAAAICYEAPHAVVQGIQDATIDVPLIPVHDLKKQLGKIASYFYGEPSRNMPVIGVTGTNGKTSCCQLLAQAMAYLQQPWGVIGTAGSGLWPNLHPATLTTPDRVQLQQQLAELLTQGCRGVAMEVSSHALVQGRVDGMKFKGVHWTNLSHDHLDYHGSMQAYAKAKQKLFLCYEADHWVINYDDMIGRELLQQTHTPMCVYGLQPIPNSDQYSVVQLKDLQSTDQGFCGKLVTSWGEGVFRSHLLGQFNVSNVLGVLSHLLLMDIPLPEALLALSAVKGIVGRMECFGGQEMPRVVVDFAHTPDALEQALQSLRSHCSGQLICVFGCGGDRDPQKRPLMGKIAEKYSDKIVITNDNPRTEAPLSIAEGIMGGLGVTPQVQLDRRLAIEQAISDADIGDIVLIAGKGHEDYQQIGKIKKPFRDQTIVKQALGQWEQDHAIK